MARFIQDCLRGKVYATFGTCMSELIGLVHALPAFDTQASCVQSMNVALVFAGAAIAPVNLSLQFCELDSDVRCVAIQDRGIAGVNLSRVVQDDDLPRNSLVNKQRVEWAGSATDDMTVSFAHLGQEAFALDGRVVLRISRNVSTLDVLNRQRLDVEANVVSGASLQMYKKWSYSGTFHL
jgi:hypothetical protein